MFLALRRHSSCRQARSCSSVVSSTRKTKNDARTSTGSRGEILKPRTTPGRLSMPKRKFAANSAVDTDVLTSTDTAEETHEFNWFKYWWPVQLPYNLDTDRPNRLQLMGEFFAVWKSKSGDWIAMKDVCPHRMAPLSEGRLEEDGTLMCSYHGWRFNDCGKCVRIPQADNEKVHQAASNNPRSSAKTFPCKERGGIVWLWPDDSETAFEEAAATPVSLPESYADHYDKEVKAGLRPFVLRSFPYDYEILIENLSDATHLPTSHHNVLPGMYRSDAKFLGAKRVDPLLPNAEIAVEFVDSSGVLNHFVRIGPCLSILLYPREKPIPGKSRIIFLAAPVHDGKSIFIADAVPEGLLTGTEADVSSSSFLEPFRWILHLASLEVTDGDLIFLHGQDNQVREVAPDGWNPQLYFTPSSDDKLTLMLRQWMAKEGGGGPFGTSRKEKRGMLPRREALDRYINHTSDCKICQEALERCNTVQSVSKSISRVFLLISAAIFVNGAQQGSQSVGQQSLCLVGFGVFAAVEVFLREKIIPRFYFVDYVHADRN